MDKCLYRGVDIFNPIEKNFCHYIDAFSKVYGERYRPVIEKRLKDAKYYFLGGSFDTAIERFKEKKQEELNALKKYNLTPSLMKLKEKDISDKYDLIVGVFQGAKTKKENIEKSYKQSISEFLGRRINVVRTNNKLPDLDKKQSNFYGAVYNNLLYFGKNRMSQNPQSIPEAHKEQFVELFKSMGYDVKDFDSAVKDKQLVDNLFTYDVLTIIHTLNMAKNKEIDKVNFCVTDLDRELKKLDIHRGHQPFVEAGTEFIQNKSGNSAFVVNCLTMKNGFKTLCFCKNALELTLEDLVHEMGHIIDAFVVESNSQYFYYKSGFELHHYAITNWGLEFNKLPQPGDKHYRRNELFNEMVNEFVALKVCAELKTCGKKLVFGKRKESATIKYAFGFEVFNDFLEKYYQKLIEFKMGVDKNSPVYNYFGEKNFTRLCDMAKEYIEKRVELNTRLCDGDKNAKLEIEKLKTKTKAEITSIERKIEKHIEKQSDIRIYKPTTSILPFFGKMTLEQAEQTLEQEANFVSKKSAPLKEGGQSK